MIELTGKHSTAKVFSDNVEAGALHQVQHILDQPFTSGSKVRVMPDVHSALVGVVGLTMTITDKVVPNLVGVDGGCGMLTTLLKNKRIDFNQLDKVIRKEIPSGFNIRKTRHSFMDDLSRFDFKCAKHIDRERAALSMGTLGGGNHFIEVGQDDDGQLYLIVHSGSRSLGKQVCEYYQNAAADALGRKGDGADRALAYAEGELLNDYLRDIYIVQKYADLNRKAIVRDIGKAMKFKEVEQFSTVHNYIDFDIYLEEKILRKGAVSAKLDEKIIVPMNMRDGSLLCVGKGNADWNYSAPHGAGRVMSRKEAKEKITLTEYKKAMKGVFSTSVSQASVDEAPQVYKPMDEVVENSTETMTVVKRLKSVYNFKAEA